MATESDRRRLLLVGDVEGNLTKLYTQVETQQKKAGAFDVLLGVGAFLPPAGAKEAAGQLAEYVTGKKKAPLETYFIESTSSAFLQAAPEGKQLCESVHFLGGLGIKEIKGLKVAFLSGRYDPAVYSADHPPGQCFVGPAYTKHAVERLMQQAKDLDGAPVDVLLTAEWPAGLEMKLDDVDKPKHPEGLTLDLGSSSSPAVAELCNAIHPRYHICASADIYFQRPPFQTAAGHVCRCITLGKVASKGKGRQSFHGLALSPAAGMAPEALRQRPENTTPSPFNKDATTLKGVKRAMDEGGEEAAEPEEVPDTVFLSRLPPIIDEKRIEKALKHIGKIERIHLARDSGTEGKPCIGYGWVTFSTPEEAKAACDLSELLECGGKKITICISRPRSRTESGASNGQKRKKEIQIVIEPHAECWFCLVNPNVEKHMIVTATTDVYVATARGPINPMHVQVLPVKHAPCFAACPPELQDALQLHVAALRKMFTEANQEVIVWERWIPMGTSAANHMQVQVLPVDRTKGGEAREALEHMVKQCMPGTTMKRVSSHAEVAEHLNDDATTPYMYFEIPGDLTARGRQLERYVYAGVPGGPRIPLNFGRQVVCHLLGCDDKVDWRQCSEHRDAEKKLAMTIREQFKSFQPKGKTS